MEDLDEFLSTSDEYFNRTAQNWFFLFEGPNRPDTKQSFLTIINALKKTYFFTIENYKKPFKCITYIDNVCKESTFSKNDNLILIDKLLSMLISSNKEEYEMVYLQILNHRNDIEPLTLDREFIHVNYRFDFDNIKKELDKYNSNDEKVKHLVRTMFEFDQSLPSMDALEYEYYESIGLVHLVKVELKKLQFELSSSPSNTNPKEPKAVKSFADYLLHSHQMAFAEKLKVEFGKESNIGIRLMLDALKAHTPPLIAYKNQQQLFNALKAFFGDSIGTRQGIMGVKILAAHDIDLKAFKDRLEHVLRKMNK